MATLNSSRFLFVLALSAAVAAVLLPSLQAQAVAVAGISGQVVDPTGAGVPGADVRATQVETQFNRSATTDAEGNYTLTNLPVGPYRLEVQAQGFKQQVQTGIVLQVGNNVQINIALQVGTVAERLEVTADAAMVETKNTSVSQVIDQQRITDLPLNGRDPTQLVLISGAAATAPGGDMAGSKNFYSSKTISIAGGQANGTNYLLDGGDNNDFFSNVNLPFPFPEALQEFSVETSSLPARNGLHPGGAVNIVTRSGSNAFHGDLFEYLRNGALNARNFFVPQHDALKRNQFGGDAGGRIIRDKLFFFGGYQGTRVRTVLPVASPAYVPTQSMLNGDFSARTSPGCNSGKQITLKDPVTGVAFPNNQVPVGRFDKASLNLLKYIPVATDPCGKYTYGISNPNSDNQEIGKVDWVINAKHSLFGRYFIVDYTAPAPFDAHNLLVTSQLPGNAQRAQTMTVGETWSISPEMVNSFHATFTRRRNNRGGDPAQINAAALGVNMFVAVPNDIRIQMSNNGFNVGCGTCSPGHFNVNTFQFADDLDIIRGKHQIAAGIDVIRTQQNTFAGYLQNGSFSFSNLLVGDTLAEFLMGVLDGSGTVWGQSRGQPTAMRETILGLYAQDTWKITQRLSLNYGLRWEPMLFPQDYFGRGSTFNMANLLSNTKSQVFVNAPAGSLYYGDPGVPKAWTHDKYLNFSPRLGLVWNPRGDGKQTLRAGAAILYDSSMLYFPQRIMSNPPFVNEIDLNTAQSGPFSDPWQKYPGGNPFPGVTPPPANAAFPTNAFYAILPLDLKPMNTTSWNVSYQRQFLGSWMASASYIGSKTTHLWLAYDLNAPVNLPGASVGNEAARRALTLANPVAGPYYGQISYADDGGNATYNGLLLSLQHRFSHGFTALVNYTYSHCIGDGDFNGDLRGVYYQDQRNRRADRGDCNFDIRHIFNGSFVFSSPVVGNTWTKRLLGGWQLAPLLRVAGGVPVNITSGKDNSLTGEGLDRPNLNPGVPVYNSSWGPSLQYLNPAAFSQGALGTFGNLGRDVIRYPGALNLDASLTRTFGLTEKLRLQARAEAFNVINHTNFTAYSNFGYGGLVSSLSSGTFGQITSAGDPRILQFALKLQF